MGISIFLKTLKEYTASIETFLKLSSYVNNSDSKMQMKE